ncbi:uncharacterized protein [Bemisia tabaci]|uniref:uncharacterized protein isoform X1 n=1 Tax=Bemisia tabaci TaxID=7038 RepID=UPI003B28B453
MIRGHQMKKRKPRTTQHRKKQVTLYTMMRTLDKVENSIAHSILELESEEDESSDSSDSGEDNRLPRLRGLGDVDQSCSNLSISFPFTSPFSDSYLLNHSNCPLRRSSYSSSHVLSRLRDFNQTCFPLSISSDSDFCKESESSSSLVDRKLYEKEIRRCIKILARESKRINSGNSLRRHRRTTHNLHSYAGSRSSSCLENWSLQDLCMDQHQSIEVLSSKSCVVIKKNSRTSIALRK